MHYMFLAFIVEKGWGIPPKKPSPAQFFADKSLIMYLNIEIASLVSRLGMAQIYNQGVCDNAQMLDPA